ncbi:MAG: dethiobiotin synthase [Alphaproteobacteria bacterium]|nr:MAG: dethiobiotin synthase [Alphaproteobacteria bacterium]
MPGGCFVTASGTEIGKTFVTCRLLEGLRARGRMAAAIKPVLSGWDPADDGSDAHLLQAAHAHPPVLEAGRSGPVPKIAEISPWRLEAPLSPHVAARRQAAALTPDALVAFCRKRLAEGWDPLLIEGIGGAFVPITEQFLVADWIARLALPVLLVVDSRLGALSQGIATYEALCARGITVKGVVVSQSPVEPMSFDETVASFAAFMRPPFFALPRIAPPAFPAAARALAGWYEALDRHEVPQLTRPSLS